VKYSSDQKDSWHAWLNALATNGLCLDVEEEVYCALVDGHYRTNCFDRYKSVTERSFVLPCQDVHMLYWLTCPVIKSTGANFGMDLEPAIYDDGLSVEQSLVVEVMGNNVDRQCHPYSYYHPSAPTSSGSASDDDESSSAQRVSPSFLMF
jgi:hypothetical protein